MGGTKQPAAVSSGSLYWSTRRPAARIRSMWASSPARAVSSITGPTSVASRAGLPTVSSPIASSSISSTRSAMSSCRHSRRSAEQRWPALSKPEAITSCTTCSARAEASTIIAFWPPVSAIRRASGWPGGRAARLRWMSRATSVEPVKITPRTRGSATSAAPTSSPVPGNSCSTAGGMPAAWKIRTARAAISGVCSAGLASTGLPAASAAATSPTKIASGKFHGLMQATGPGGAGGAGRRSTSAA